MSNSLKHAGDSAPSPDGIPYGAWRALKDLGVSVLHRVAISMESADAHSQVRAAYLDEPGAGDHDFNLSTMVYIPKVASGEDAEFGEFFHPKDLRPLSIVNTDNRTIANAMRLRWESILEGYVRERQQGFLPARSILRNLLEIEGTMMHASVTREAGAAVFLDFSAAFPSISQKYVTRCLQHTGLPQTAINAFSMLYDENKCQFTINGSSPVGF